MQEKYLPLGSVVILKEATKKVMIIGYCGVDTGNNNQIYDYSACLYPEGLLSSEQVLLFNN